MNSDEPKRVHVQYSCSLCSGRESARAIDNVPTHGHLCAEHYVIAVRNDPKLAFHYVGVKP